MSGRGDRGSPFGGWAASIVDYKSTPDEIVAAIRGLAGQAEPPLRVTVTVGRDADGVRSAELREALERLDASDPPVDLLSVDGNPGFSAGHNRALSRLFGGEAPVAAVVVHNPDLVLASDAVSLLVVVALRTGKLAGPVLELSEDGVATGRLDTAGLVWTWDGRHFDAGQGGSIPPGGPPLQVAGVSGACLVVPRCAYKRVVDACGEFFDEDFIAYREDAELAYRAALLGIGSTVVPNARGIHERSQRGTRRGADPWVDRLGVRNRFLIAFKYGRHRPGRSIGPWVRDVVVIAGVVLREHSSLPGLHEAWQLRGRMRAKGQRVFAAAGRSR